MVRDHTAVNDKALALVKKLNVTPEDNDTSRALTKQAAEKRADLAKLNGVEFDKAYIAKHCLDHVRARSKRELSGRWGWMLASGIIDLILATIILAGLPGTAVWALWLLVGINMVFGGSALIAMALYAREIDPRSAAPAR
jgi:hypothetical protein